MADEGKIHVYIKADGSGRMVTEGFEGPACIDFTKGLELALGAQPETTEYTPEFYSRNRERAVILRQGGE